jgi:HK97 family phage portal protein
MASWILQIVGLVGLLTTIAVVNARAGAGVPHRADRRPVPRVPPLMGLLSLVRNRTPDLVEEERDSLWPITTGPWAEALHQFGSAYVTPEKAIRNAAVYSCMDLLAGTVSTTPVDAVIRQGKKRIPIDDPPPLITSPSAIVQSDVWLFQLMIAMLGGNGFGKIVGWDGPIDGLYPNQIELLAPADVTERKVINGIGQVTIAGKVQYLYPHDDIFHVPGKFVQPGSPFGVSILETAAGSIKAGLAAEDYGSKYFTDGAHPTSIIYAEIKNLGDDQAKIIKDAYRRATTGNREPAVLGKDLKVDQVQTDPSSTQFIDLMRFEIEQVARFFGVPPSMIFAAVSGQNVTYANVSQAELSYLKRSLNVYLVRIERALGALLPAGVVVKFNRNAILQSDPEARYKNHEVRLRSCLATVNEIRAEEDLEPFDDPIYDLPGLPPGKKVADVLPTPQGGGS